MMIKITMVYRPEDTFKRDVMAYFKIVSDNMKIIMHVTI